MYAFNLLNFIAFIKDIDRFAATVFTTFIFYVYKFSCRHIRSYHDIIYQISIEHSVAASIDIYLSS